MGLKETIDDPQILKKILGILTPREFTRVDEIIDVVFSTAEEAIQETATEQEAGRSLEEGRSEASIRVAPASFYDACIQHVATQLGRSLVKQSRTFYASPDGSVSVLCVVSRAYEHQTRHGFWYA